MYKGSPSVWIHSFTGFLQQQHSMQNSFHEKFHFQPIWDTRNCYTLLVKQTWFLLRDKPFCLNLCFMNKMNSRNIKNDQTTETHLLIKATASILSCANRTLQKPTAVFIWLSVPNWQQQQQKTTLLQFHIGQKIYCNFHFDNKHTTESTPTGQTLPHWAMTWRHEFHMQIISADCAVTENQYSLSMILLWTMKLFLKVLQCKLKTKKWLCQAEERQELCQAEDRQGLCQTEARQQLPSWRQVVTLPSWRQTVTAKLKIDSDC